MGTTKNSPGCNCCSSCGVNEDTRLFSALTVSGMADCSIVRYSDHNNPSAGISHSITLPNRNGTYLINAIEPNTQGLGNCEIPSADLPIRLLGGSSKNNCCQFIWKVDDEQTINGITVKSRFWLSVATFSPLSTQVLHYFLARYICFVLPNGGFPVYWPGPGDNVFQNGPNSFNGNFAGRQFPSGLVTGNGFNSYLEVNNVSGQIVSPLSLDWMWYSPAGGFSPGFFAYINVGATTHSLLHLLDPTGNTGRDPITFEWS